MTHNQIERQAVYQQALANREVARHNVAQERETNRHQVVTENLEAQRNAINDFSAQETQRHNLYMEQLQTAVVNKDYYLAQETQRHNLAMERNTQEANAINSYLAAENERHNRNTESISLLRTSAQNVKDYADAWYKTLNTGVDVKKKKAEIKKIDYEAESEKYRSSILQKDDKWYNADKVLDYTQRISNTVESWSRTGQNVINSVKSIMVPVKSK